MFPISSALLAAESIRRDILSSVCEQKNIAMNYIFQACAATMVLPMLSASFSFLYEHNGMWRIQALFLNKIYLIGVAKHEAY
jgi:hypothetical protein